MESRKQWNVPRTQTPNSTNSKSGAGKVRPLKSDCTAPNICSSRDRGWKDRGDGKGEVGEMNKWKRDLIPLSTSTLNSAFCREPGAEGSLHSLKGFDHLLNQMTSSPCEPYGILSILSPWKEEAGFGKDKWSSVNKPSKLHIYQVTHCLWEHTFIPYQF